MWVWVPIGLLVVLVLFRVAYVYVIAPPEQPWDPKSQK